MPLLADRKRVDKPEIDIVDTENGALASLKGRVDIDSSPAVRDRLLALLHAPRPRAVSIDLSRVGYPAYYTLNLPAPPAAENVRTSIAVREFQSPNYLRQGPIVYRTTPEEIGFYEYHRWAADPRTLLTSAVIDHLRAGGQVLHGLYV